MSQRLVALAALGLIGCNAMFGIEEGYLQEEPDQDEAAGALTDPESAGASQTDRARQLAGAGPPASPMTGAAPPASPMMSAAAPGSMPSPAAPAPEAPTVLSEPLSFSDWRVVPDNALGLYGTVSPAWGSGAVVEPNCGNGSCAADQPPDGFCFTGHLDAAPVLADGARDFPNYWGAQVALGLRDAASDGDVWNRSGGRALGVAFQVEGSQVPPLRLNVTLPPVPEESFPVYCEDLAANGREEVRFDRLVRDCWNPSSTQSLDPTQAMSFIAWNIPATTVDLDFAFCVRQIQLILSPE
jgi:hypothetical protein